MHLTTKLLNALPQISQKHSINQELIHECILSNTNELDENLFLGASEGNKEVAGAVYNALTPIINGYALNHGEYFQHVTVSVLVGNNFQIDSACFVQCDLGGLNECQVQTVLYDHFHAVESFTPVHEDRKHYYTHCDNVVKFVLGEIITDQKEIARFQIIMPTSFYYADH